jgi:SAM-dependent methyltransferase
MDREEKRKENEGSKLIFCDAIKALLASGGTISANVHALLLDLIHHKEDSFFDLVLHRSDDDFSYRIDHLDEIIEGKLEQVLQNLFSDCSYELARSASVKEREENDLLTDSLVYGEMEFSSIKNILKFLKRDARGGKFYDIGSGSGRAVFTARVLQDFDCCVGIELLPNLHELAVSVTNGYNETWKRKLAFGKVEFHCEDFLKYDWSDGDVVFAHSTCFEDDLLQSLFSKAKDLSPGSFLISCKSCGIDYTAFDLITEMRQKTSWGESDIFVFRRCR